MLTDEDIERIANRVADIIGRRLDAQLAETVGVILGAASEAGAAVAGESSFPVGSGKHQRAAIATLRELTHEHGRVHVSQWMAALDASRQRRHDVLASLQRSGVVTVGADGWVEITRGTS